MGAKNMYLSDLCVCCVLIVFKSDNIHIKIETESNRIVYHKIESKSIEIDKAES